MAPMPVVPPTATIERALLACGINGEGVSVRWEGAAEGFIIVIHDRAGATTRHIPCIDKVAQANIMIFDDAALQAAYTRYVQDRERPRLIAEATSALKTMGLLDGMPRRAAYADQAGYIAALEHHGGVSGVLQANGGGEALLRYPPGEDLPTFERMQKVIAVVIYATAVGDLASFAFIGNAALPAAR